MLAVTTRPARRLIVALAGFTVLFNLAVALPGNPYVPSLGESVVAVVIQTLVLWGLWRGSAVAWWVATLFAVGQIVSITLMAPEPEVSVFLVLALSVVMTAILFTREVRTFVNTGGRAVRTQRDVS
jgi:hypothetical protein